MDKLAGSIRGIGDQVQKLEGLTSKNAEQINDVNTNIRLMLSEVGHVKSETGKLSAADEKHDQKIVDLQGNFRTFSVLVYIFWAILLLILGGCFTKYLLPRIFG